MLAYTAGDTDVPLLNETLGANFERIAALFPLHDALIEAAAVPGEEARRWSYTKLNEDADRLARALLALGVARGERIGIWSPNCAEWTILQYAAAKAGAVLVNLNPAWGSRELESVARHSGLRMLLVAPSDKDNDYPGMARQALAECPELRDLVFLPDSGVDGLAAGEPQAGAERTFAELLRRADDVGYAALKARMAELDPHDASNLQYTAGTTGFPKGAVLTHHGVLNNGHSVGELLSYTQEDRVVVPLPFHHCFGMVAGNVAAFSHGAATIIPSRAFTAAAALEAVQDFGGTSLCGVPTMFMAELALADFASYDLSTLRTGVMAGAPCPLEVMERVVSDMEMAGIAVCYGMTETSPVSTMTLSADALARRAGTAGRTLPHLESRIEDPSTGAVLQRGETGELCVRGYAVMKGYWGQPEEPEKTAAPVDSEGWLHTGDRARMEEDGYIVIEGRLGP